MFENFKLRHKCSTRGMYIRHVRLRNMSGYISIDFTRTGIIGKGVIMLSHEPNIEEIILFLKRKNKMFTSMTIEAVKITSVTKMTSLVMNIEDTNSNYTNAKKILSALASVLLVLNDKYLGTIQ